MDRKKIAIKSSIIGFASQILVFIASFAVRTVFIKYLSTEILGIDGVLKNCVSMLSLADLGIGTAMVYRLYKPVNDRDEDTLGQLLNLYRLIYRYIICTVALISIVVGLLLPIIITGIYNISWLEIYLAYLFQVIGIITSYLMAYKRCFISATQNNYVIVSVDALCNVIACILKIFILTLFHNYPMYLLMTIFQYALSNIILFYYSRSLKYTINNKNKWTEKQKRCVLNDTKQLVVGKIAGYVYSSTDNIIISIFLSTFQVGMISNYKYLFAIITTFINGLVSSMGTIIGNKLNDSILKSEAYDLLKIYSFARFVIAEVLIVPAIVLSQNFICIWAGERYLLSNSIVILIAAELYIGCVYGPLGEYMGGLGYFRYDKTVSICGAATNIFFSLIGVKMYGCIGVFMGTMLSQIVMWIGKSVIIFGIYFESERKYLSEYIQNELLYLFITFILSVLGNTLIKHFPLPGYLGFCIHGIIIEGIILTILIVFFRKTTSFKYLQQTLISQIKIYKRS